MASANAPARTGFKSDQHRSAPAFDHAYAKKAWLSVRNGASGCRPRRGSQPVLDKPQRLEDLVEPDRDTRGHVAGGLRGHFHVHLVVGRPREVRPEVMRNARGSRRQACGVEFPRLLLSQNSRLAKSVLNTRMIVVDVPHCRRHPFRVLGSGREAIGERLRTNRTATPPGAMKSIR